MRLHFSSTSIFISLIVIPLLLLISILLVSNPQSYSFSPSWKPFAFFSSNSTSPEASSDHSHESIYVRSLALSTPHFLNEAFHQLCTLFFLWNKQKEEQERLEKIEASLAKARSSIREASGNEVHLTQDQVDDDHDEYTPMGPAYWNANAFLR